MGTTVTTTSQHPADSPAITVIIPLYKGEAYLAETLDSVMAQTYAPATVLVLDDGSPDESYRIAERYGDRLQLLRRQNAGVSATRNFAASIATTEWLHFLDQDDVWEPTHLENIARAILANPDADAVYTGRRVLQEDRATGSFSLTAPVSLPDTAAFPGHLLDRCPFTPSSACLRKASFLKAGQFDTRFNGMEDWDLFLRMSRQGARFVHVPAATVQYRVHAAANTNNPLPLLKVGRAIVRDDINPQLSTLGRLTHGRRVESRLEAEAAILLRENGQPGGLNLMLRSILRHPFHEPRRYRIAAHMLLHGDVASGQQRTR